MRISYRWYNQRSLKLALQAGHNLLLAQGAGFREIKRLQPAAQVGTVCNPIPAYARSLSPADLRAQRLSAAHNTHWFLDPLFGRGYPAELAEARRADMPAAGPADMRLIAVGPELHALGVNYYCGTTVQAPAGGSALWENGEEQYALRNSLGWPVYVEPAYPRGLCDLLLCLWQRYEGLGLKRMAITENGTAWPSPAGGAEPDDSFRISYLRAHLEQLHAAMRAGVPVEGYFVWTLLDNFEWAEGYRPESAFGLVQVDRDTFKRTPKRSYGWYRDVVRSRKLTG